MIETLVVACESLGKKKAVLELLYGFDKDRGYGTRNLVSIRNINKKLSNRFLTKLLEKRNTWTISEFKDFPYPEEEIREIYEKCRNRKVYHIYKFKINKEKYED